MEVYTFEVPNEPKIPPPWYEYGEAQIGNLSQHAKMTPVPKQKDYYWPHGRPQAPIWMPSAKPPEPWRDPDRTPDFLGLQEPYRDREEVGDGGRLGGEFVYQVAEGSRPGQTKFEALQCTLF